MKQSTNKNHNAIIVLGMHRSGTSALARTLNLCGVDLGSNLMPPGPEDNVKGFWEHMDIYQTNEKLLQDLGSSWDDVRALPDGWWNLDMAEAYKLEIISILERDFSNSPFWGVKDPRICRLLPVWHPILEQTDNKPFFLIIVRNPLEVVASLSKRDGFSKGKSCLLWLKHLIESEKGTRNTSRMFATYEELLSDWKGLLTRVEKTFGFKWPVQSKKVSSEIKLFLQDSMRHNRVTDTTLTKDKTLSKWIRDLYQAINGIVDGDDARLIKTVNTVEAKLKEAVSLYEPALTDIWDKYNASNTMLQERNQQLDDVNNQIEEFSQDRGYHLSSIDHLQSGIKEKADRIQQLDSELAGFRNELSTVQQTVAGRETEVTHLETAIKERDDRVQELDAELTSLRRELASSQKDVSASEAGFANLETNIKEKADRIQQLDSELAGFRNVLSTVQQTVAARETEVTHLETDIKERDERIQQLDAELAGLREEFAASQQAVKEFQTIVDKLQTRIKEGDDRIQRLDSDASILREESSTLEGVIAERDAQVTHLQGSTQEKDVRIHQLDADVGNLRDEVDSLRTHGENYRLERESIFDSTSWKLTAPLRWISVNARYFRRNLGAARYFFSRQYRLIKKSGLFDTAYYLDQNPDVANSKMNPLAHYLKYGWKDGRSPSQKFETSNYLKQNPEISESKADPLSDYLNNCKKEGKDPNTIFQNTVNNPYVSNLLISDTIPHTDLNNKNGKKLNGVIMASIIIYVSSLRDLQHECVESIKNTTKRFYHEIMVVTNEGTDDDINAAKDYQGMKIINVREACYFHCLLEASKTAEGKYCIFLNNTSVVMDGWLDHLISVLEANNLAGMIGSKILNSDGKIEDVGGIVWSNGKIFQYGYLEAPDLPEYNYLKEVDYISGNSFIIRKELLSDIGGFDCMFSKDIYSYIDLAFKIRKRGFKVLYHPKSVVVITDKENSNSDRTKIFNFNTNNSDGYKLKKKWSEVLNKYHLKEGNDIHLARDRSQGKKRILVVDHYVPEFDMDSGSLRMFNLLKIMSELDYKVIFWPENRAYQERYAWALQKIGIEVLYGAIDFEKYLKMNGEYIEVIILSRPHIAINFIDAAKRLTNAKIIYDTVDLVFLREERRAKLEGKKLENGIKTTELLLANKADKVLVVSPVEKEILENQGLKGKVSVITNVHSLKLVNNSFENRAGLMFIGGFMHQPNEDGIAWFVQSIFPLINKNLPGIHLYIVGSHPTEKVKSLASSNVTVTGYVKDVSFYFEKCRAFVSPLRYGAGVKGKIGQSMAYGLPVVTTPIGAEGMDVTDGYNILIADNESQFAEKVVKVYQDPKSWKTLSLNARTLIKQKYTPNAIKKELSKVLRDTLKPYQV